MPTDEELAAIVGVLLSRTPTTGPASTQPTVSRWAAAARPGVRRPDGRPVHPHGSAWRASALPR